MIYVIIYIKKYLIVFCLWTALLLQVAIRIPRIISRFFASCLQLSSCRKWKSESTSVGHLNPFGHLRTPPSQNMYPFEQRKINFPLKIFQKFFYEKIPEWCPESTGITTSLQAFWFTVLRGVKFSKNARPP